MKKIIIYIVIGISVLLIALGIIFTFTEKEDKNTGSQGNDVMNIEEIKNEENIYGDNVNIYKTLDDAVTYLKNLYLTEDVVVTYNDEIKVTIKIFKETENEMVYTYYIAGGDLIISK